MILEQLNVIADVRAKVALQEHIISRDNKIDLIKDKRILGGLKVQSYILQTTIVSNLRKELPAYIAKVRVMNF